MRRYAVPLIALCILVLGCAQEPSNVAEGSPPPPAGGSGTPESPPQTASSESPELRPDLVRSYQDFIEACETGDENSWRDSISPYLYANVKNLYTSAKRAFDSKTIKDFPKYYPRLEGEPLEVLRNGPTASLVYPALPDHAGTPAFPSSKGSTSVTILRFVSIDGTWKLDRVGAFGLPIADTAGFEPSMIPEDIAIDGTLPEPPPLFAVPDFAGYLDVHALGYRADVEINGRPFETVSGESYSGLIPGGLTKGDNPIRIRVGELEEGPVKKFEVAVSIVNEQGERERVFELEPEGAVEPRYEATIRPEVR